MRTPRWSWLRKLLIVSSICLCSLSSSSHPPHALYTSAKALTNVTFFGWPKDDVWGSNIIEMVAHALSSYRGIVCKNTLYIWTTHTNCARAKILMNRSTALFNSREDFLDSPHKTCKVLTQCISILNKEFCVQKSTLFNLANYIRIHKLACKYPICNWAAFAYCRWGPSSL